MRFQNQKFEGQPINLDFNTFDQCEFIGCSITYLGVGGWGLNGCQFNGCQFVLDGPAIAAMGFLQQLASIPGDGRQIVESFFSQVLNGAAFRSDTFEVPGPRTLN